MTLKIVPVRLQDAQRFVGEHHRHHKPPVSWKFGCAVEDDGRLCGVIMVGRPVARGLDDGTTLEVIRCCTDGTKNAASKLYGAAWRAARALGYHRLVTYILESEDGTTLRASSWRYVHTTKAGKSWDTPSRRRVDQHPLVQKQMWEAG